MGVIFGNQAPVEVREESLGDAAVVEESAVVEEAVEEAVETPVADVKKQKRGRRRK